LARGSKGVVLAWRLMLWARLHPAARAAGWVGWAMVPSLGFGILLWASRPRGGALDTGGTVPPVDFPHRLGSFWGGAGLQAWCCHLAIRRGPGFGGGLFVTASRAGWPGLAFALAAFDAGPAVWPGGFGVCRGSSCWQPGVRFAPAWGAWCWCWIVAGQPNWCVLCPFCCTAVLWLWQPFRFVRDQNAGVCEGDGPVGDSLRKRALAIPPGDPSGVWP